jgi:NAD(P)-dependent dehydrogenase (short-subunit alcohol dehydrogenase family)
MLNGAGNSVRLKGKIAIVVGAGQSPGKGMGNGRATVLRFVQEGATVMAADRDLASAEETVAMARQRPHKDHAFRMRLDLDLVLQPSAEVLIQYTQVRLTHGLNYRECHVAIFLRIADENVGHRNPQAGIRETRNSAQFRLLDLVRP